MSDSTLTPDDVLNTTVKSGTGSWYEVISTDEDDTVELIAVDATNTSRSRSVDQLLEDLNEGDWETVYEGTTREVVADGGHEDEDEGAADADTEHFETFAGTVVMDADDTGHIILDDGSDTCSVILGAFETAVSPTDVEIGDDLEVRGPVDTDDRIVADEAEFIDFDHGVDTGERLATDGGQNIILVKPNGKRGIKTHHLPSADDPTKPKCRLNVDGPSEWQQTTVEKRPHTELCNRCAENWGGGSTGETMADRLDEADPEDLGLSPSGERLITDGGNTCSECGAVLPEEIIEGTGVYCDECGTGQMVTDGGVTSGDIKSRPATKTMHLDALRDEWAECWHMLVDNPHDADLYNALHDRAASISHTLEQRVDVHYPECPNCGATSWGQEPGEALLCGDCLRTPNEAVTDAVHHEWERMGERRPNVDDEHVLVTDGGCQHPESKVVEETHRWDLNKGSLYVTGTCHECDMDVEETYRVVRESVEVSPEYDLVADGSGYDVDGEAPPATGQSMQSVDADAAENISKRARSQVKARAMRALIEPGDDVRLDDGKLCRVIETATAGRFTGYALNGPVDVQQIPYSDIDYITETRSRLVDELSLLSDDELERQFKALVKEIDTRDRAIWRADR
ncbi:hypothetical protein C5B90_19245 [Haloferax sp. Atlit-12N]|uniref:hypothetical protein n=1 Tax=Haloferax sp. Atlit-12N TaxID=2077203 RepID=UPI000E27FB09|nr:hypothetical protein [Haloferax sp. Atlit-12N]RDZ61408.1 hypothetical protein C5B90_19245 [Haloferax sp. Atlit-12N]